MFSDLYDAISMIWSGRWPIAEGEVTAVDLERIRRGTARDDTVRLAIAFKFSVGEDGPYTGESFWQPSFCVKRRVIAARRKVRVRQRVTVRYRRDDPSVSTLDRQLWRDL